MSDFAACWELARGVNGWLTRAEARLLYETARALSAGSTVVEIGSFFGRSTVCLARGSQDGTGAVVHAIDPQLGSQKHTHLLGCDDPSPWLLANLARAGVEKVVSVHKLTSAQAAAVVPGPIDLLFIDGSHEQESVQTDFALWFPKLRVGGSVLFHDSWHMSGVRRATADLLGRATLLCAPRLIDTITMCTKGEQPRRHRAYLASRWLRGPLGFLRLTYGGTRLRWAGT
jgi:predicted O-methyltransferase YrrM